MTGTGTTARGTRLLVPALITLVALLVVAADVLFLPYFSDDFHLVDVGRNRSLLELLSGRFGIIPWYRPLSRELYFALLARAGDAGPLLGHAILAASVALAAVWIYRIAARLASPRAGVIGAALFVTYQATKFLASWCSGFQDLLAVVLMLGTIAAWQSARHRTALVLAALAPLAKEPAFIVYPMLLAYLWLVEPPGALRRHGRAVALSALVPIAIHALVRTTWPSAVHLDPAENLDRLSVVFLGAARFFAGGDMPPTFRGILLAGAAAGLTWLAIRRSGTLEPAPGRPPASRAALWLATAAVLGMLPTVMGHLLLTHTHPYHLISAIPWICIGIGAALARVPTTWAAAAVALLVFWNAVTLGGARLDLDDPAEWSAKPFTWRDAVRTSGVTERLGADLRGLLADRPDSLVVLFLKMPPRVFFQTEDGPAARELLRDPTIRSYWSSEAPWLPEERPIRILTFDFDSLHLRPARWSPEGALFEASNTIVADRGGTAAAIVRYAIRPGEAEPARTYLLAASELVARGAGAYQRRLEALGWADSTAPRLEVLAPARAGGDPSLIPAHLGVVRRPLTAASYVALADSYAVQGTVQGSSFALRMAIALKPDLWPERFRLVDYMLQLGGGREALEELNRIASDPAAGAYAGQARAIRAGLEERDAERLRNASPDPAP